MLFILYVVEHERADYERRIQAHLLERSLLEPKKKRPNLITYLVSQCIRLILNNW